MSDQIPHIQKARETLAHCEQLRVSESFKWFMAECVELEMQRALFTILDINKTMMEVEKARHVYAALKDVKTRLESQRKTAQQFVDSQRQK